MSEASAPAMDYAEHERTYAGFISFAQIGTIALLNIMLCLALITFGGGIGAFLGSVFTVLTLVAVAMGAVIKGKSWVPSAVVFVVSGLFLIMTTV